HVQLDPRPPQPARLLLCEEHRVAAESAAAVLWVDLDVEHPQALGLAVRRFAQPQHAHACPLAVLDGEEPVALRDRAVRERLGGAAPRSRFGGVVVHVQVLAELGGVRGADPWHVAGDLVGSERPQARRHALILSVTKSRTSAPVSARASQRTAWLPGTTHSRQRRSSAAARSAPAAPSAADSSARTLTRGAPTSR